MSGLVEYLYKILEPTPSGDLPCALGDGIFPQSGVITTTKVHAGASRDEKHLMKRLTSIRQSVELQYGNFFNKQRIFCHEESFKLFRDQETAYKLCIVGFFLLNCSTCFNGCVVKTFFDTLPLTLQEHLSD